jgi:hypothetical protein
LHRAYVPQWNSWQPKLMTIGAAFLEFAAARAVAGTEHGAVQVGRAVMNNQALELAATEGFRAPLERVVAATNRLAMLTDSPVRAAAFRLGEAAAGAGEAYGRDNLWHRKAAKDAREKADSELYAAIENLHAALGDSRQPAPRPVRWWRRSVTAAHRPRPVRGASSELAAGTDNLK